MNEVLDSIQALADAATKGPWAVDVDEEGFDGASVYLNDSGFGTAYICQDMRQGPTEGEADAEFIANAREDVPKLVAALKAVLEVHVDTCEASGMNCDNTVCPVGICGPCGESWPCPTITSIESVLNG